MKRFSKKAFTLAEVLITLGIIGVVAAMTIPTLINYYAKNATVTKLQKAYTVLFQGAKLSENDNGDISSWNVATTSDGSAILNWFNTYLAHYIKYTKADICSGYPICNAAGGAGQQALVYLPDGTILMFWYPGTWVHVFVFINGETKVTGGRDYFCFFMGGVPEGINIKEVRPYDHLNPIPATIDRNTWKNDGWGGCNNNASNAAKPYCAALIMYDSWQIKSDYPYFN